MTVLPFSKRIRMAPQSIQNRSLLDEMTFRCCISLKKEKIASMDSPGSVSPSLLRWSKDAI